MKQRNKAQGEILLQEVEEEYLETPNKTETTKPQKTTSLTWRKVNSKLLFPVSPEICQLQILEYV